MRDFLTKRSWSPGSQIAKLGAAIFAAGRVDIAVTGLEHVPSDGPALLVARHYHYFFDGIALLVSVPRPVHILVALDWVRSGSVRRFLTLIATMARWPVVLRSDAPRPSARRHPTWMEKIVTAHDISHYRRRALEDAVALLTEGRVLAVFPEGYPSIDPHYTRKTRPDEVLPFKAGFAIIAAAAEKRLGARVPMVPVGFSYTKRDGWAVRMNIGKAVFQEQFGSRRSLTSYMEERVAELSGLLVAGRQVNR